MQSATSVDAVNCIKLTPHPRRKKNALSSDVMVTYAEGVRNERLSDHWIPRLTSFAVIDTAVKGLHIFITPIRN